MISFSWNIWGFMWRYGMMGFLLVFYLLWMDAGITWRASCIRMRAGFLLSCVGWFRTGSFSILERSCIRLLVRTVIVVIPGSILLRFRRVRRSLCVRCCFVSSLLNLIIGTVCRYYRTFGCFFNFFCLGSQLSCRRCSAVGSLVISRVSLPVSGLSSRLLLMIEITSTCVIFLGKSSSLLWKKFPYVMNSMHNLLRC